MKSILGRSMVLIALMVIVPLSAIAQDYKIDKPVVGFYLGERKSEVFSRLKKAGIGYELISESSEPDNYHVERTLAGSELFNYITLSFMDNYLSTIYLQFKDNSLTYNMEYVRQIIQDSWNITPTQKNGDFLSAYVFKCPPVDIVLVRTPALSGEGYTISVVYLHQAVLNLATKTKGKEKQPLLGKQF